MELLYHIANWLFWFYFVIGSLGGIAYIASCIGLAIKGRSQGDPNL